VRPSIRLRLERSGVFRRNDSFEKCEVVFGFAGAFCESAERGKEVISTYGLCFGEM